MSATTRQSSAQAYLQQHRVGALFEELMASLIRDQPQEPLLHLMRALQRKASDRGLLKSAEIDTPVLKPSAAAPTKSLAATTSGVGGARQYDKPWLSTTATATTSSTSNALGKSGIRKSSSGNVAAASMQADVGYGGFERQRQSTRASLTPASGGPFDVAAVNAWEINDQTPKAVMTAAELAQVEADILGSEFRLARASNTSDAIESTASSTTNSSTATVDDSSTSIVKGNRRTAIGARQAAREARMKQLEANLAQRSNAKAAAGTDSAIGSGPDDADEFEADGVLLIEDADALAAEGVRVSQRSDAGKAAIVTARRHTLGVDEAATAAAAEPQVRMTFCGRCFALINQEEEAAALATAGATSRIDSARGGFASVDVGGGFGFAEQSSGGLGGMGADVDRDLDDLEPFAAPQTGRTNATMTEVTDIESASQVTGPRRPSWGGAGGGASRSGTPRQKRSSGRQHQDSTGSISSNLGAGGRGFETVTSSTADAGFSIGASRGGWGAAAAAAAADADLSDQDTERDRHLQQDVRLY